MAQGRGARLEREAWQVLEGTLMRWRGRPVGARAALHPGDEPANYGHCFLRDFYVAGLAFLAAGRPEPVAGFLEAVCALQCAEPHLDCFRPGRGLMPASFAVVRGPDGERLEADFGERAIGRVAPVDAGFWWVLLLRAYRRATGDAALAARPPVQRALALVLELALLPRFEMRPTLLVPEAGYLIDRRLGVYGHPLDVQVLLFGALRAGAELAEDPRLQAACQERLAHLTHHLRRRYWLDFPRLNALHRARVEEFGVDADNPYNLRPEAIPTWVFPWVPDEGGYFAGNLGPGRLDFRWFALGNLLAVPWGLAEPPQARAILDLLARRRGELVAEMPLKLVYPPLEGRDWELLTGWDVRNVPWSYHNGGSWPMLLWALTA
ncbi:MAG: alkaline invertase, partial [Gammaproteobacteria bacterium]